MNELKRVIAELQSKRLDPDFHATECKALAILQALHVAQEAHPFAQVVLTAEGIEVTVGSWGEDCPASQVYSQASEEARRRVERLADAHCRVLPNTVSVRSITTDMELKA